MSKTKVYPKGLFINEPNEGAPDFVKGRMSIKVVDLVTFLNENKNEAGYVNLDLLQGDKGMYSVLNDWKPSSPKEAAPSFKPVATQDSDDGGLPF